MTLALACNPAPTPPKGILLVTVDTWRADHLNARTSPQIHGLADKGLKFERAFSPIGLTSAAHASLFTGLLPPRHGVRGNNHHGYTLAPSFLTLAESLQSHSWDTAAFTTGWPAGPEGGLGQGFDVFLAPAKGERPTQEALAEFQAWHAEREGPWFAWVHAYDPHGPYNPPEQDAKAIGGEGEKAAYAAEVHAMDRQIAPLLKELLAQDSTVVITSDHGEVLNEEPCHWQHERSSSQEVLQVPLVLLGPGIKAGVRQDIAGLHDLFPTFHSLAGLPDPGNHEGKDLLAGPTDRTAWVGESGFCESDCAPGCDPAGFVGKDRVVWTEHATLIDRPGAGLLGEESLARHLEGYAKATAPQGVSTPEAVKALGYVQ